MIDREKLAQELILREHVRIAIGAVKKRRVASLAEIKQSEHELREIIRSLIPEGNAVATSAKHANTGINVLEDLLKNSNILSVLQTGYKSLTTDKTQRDSYRNHIEVFIQKALAPEEERKNAGRMEEDLTIDIDRPEDDPDFIDVDPAEKSEEEIELDDVSIPGSDLTGRNKAYRDFKNIEKVILQAFDDLDNTIDSTLFEEYLIKNVALYFDKFEAELSSTVEEPEAALDATLDADAETGADSGGLDADDEIANIELQELIQHLNLDDIIENML